MSFAQPLFLVGLVLVPLALAVYLNHERARRSAAAAFAAPALMGSLAPRTPGWRRHVPLAVYGLALVILVIALARPQTTVAVPVERASIMLTIDYSGSMQAVDIAPSRLEAGRAAAERFLEEVPGSVRVGLVAFNHSARLLQSPTTDRGAVLSAIRAVRPSGGTATGEALAVSIVSLARETDDQGGRVPSAIILLSDGASVRGRPPQDLARRARAQKIPIYTVALGTPAGTIQVTDSRGRVHTRPVPPDPTEMREVAKLSGGRAFTADTAEGLSSVYKELGSRIGHRNEKREVTAAFTGSALALLAAGALLSLYWFRRLV
ncbi:MAG: Ca-activated chloride channel [Solirubrobacteraceae bacterium]|jgi:Ca-activated chloride channel family protein|nr:Ca-activated chloride channel [Solirubrobacteraceae bacterium]MEA2184741.1 Ca-activated chloride channel [Solirubrobacteraceae bacterium]MEA2185197.1 Ca-activated chloride channel [Solirubrobacteraceae bacterium]